MYTVNEGELCTSTLGKVFYRPGELTLFLL